EGGGVAVLVERLDLHGIVEIALPANPPPAQLFELLQALADQPGAHDVTSRLAAAGADRIRIAPVGQPPSAAAPRGPVASSEDFGARDPVIPNPETPVDRKSGALGTAGILRGESMRDIKSVPLEGVPLVTHDPPPPKPADVLADLDRNSTSPTVGDLLAALIDLAASAAKLGHFEQVLGVISGITHVEEKVAEASGVRRQYTIALRRIYTKPVLEGLSRLLA